MSKIKAVLFDFDGTIADTNELILGSWRHTYKTLLGRECKDEEVLGTFGEVLSDTMINRFPGHDVDECIEIYRSWQHERYEQEIEAFPGIKELIKSLKEKGFLTAVVTSRLTSSTMQGLTKFGLDKMLDALVSCDDTNKHKPDPTPLLIALKKLGLTPKDAIYVGDSKFDIQCAHNAGMKAILVNWTVCLPIDQRVGENKADFEVDEAFEILDIVEKL